MLLYLDAWFPDGRSVWEELGVASLEEMCYSEWAMRFQKTHAIPVVLSVLWLCSRCKLSAIVSAGYLPAAMLPTIIFMNSSPLEL